MEVIKETGWSLEYVLNMRAVCFFSLKRALFDINREENLNKLIQACDVQAISICDSKYYTEIKQYYNEQLIGKKINKLNSRFFDMETEEDRMKVDKILSSTFEQKLRLMGLK